MANTVLRDFNANKAFKIPVNTGTTISAGELVKISSDEAVKVASSTDTVAGVVIDGIDDSNDSKFDQYLTVTTEAVVEATAAAAGSFSFGDPALYTGSVMASSGTADVFTTGQTDSVIKAMEKISGGSTGKFIVDTSI